MSENKLLDAALHYAEKFGWPVLPCKPNKDPYTPNGFYDAKTDPNAIKFWWTKWPDAMIGVRTGPASGLIVIDKDIDDEKGKDGPAEVRAWERESGYTLPETVTAVSGRGGEHLYYMYPPEGLENDSCREFILPDVDIRGDKGYIINKPEDAVVLPSTGGFGTTPFYTIGLLLIAFAAGLYTYLNRKNLIAIRSDCRINGTGHGNYRRGGGDDL